MTNLGLPLKGGMLTRIPPNSTSDEQIGALNEIIDKLNTWNGVIVQQGTKVISIGTQNAQSFEIPHNLGYAPIPFAYLNHVGITITGSTTLNIPLPTFLGLSTNGVVPGAVVETSGIRCMVDENKLYLLVFNATGVALGNFTVSYYLMRITAQQ